MRKTTSDWDCHQHSFDFLFILKDTEAPRLFLCAQQSHGSIDALHLCLNLTN